MGRGRIILKGGNRGIEPKSSVVTVRYGDLSEPVDQCSAGLRCTLKEDDRERNAGITEVASGVSLGRAKTRRFSRSSHRGLHRYCSRQRQ